MKLYEIVGQYRELYDMIDEETDPQLISDTIEAMGLDEALEEKADGYVRLIKNIMAEAKAYKSEANIFEAKAKARENLASRLTKRLYDAMVVTGVKEIPNDLFTIKIKANGGVQPLIYVEGKDIPEEYQKVTIEADNSKIREALKSGKDLDFVSFGERGTHLEIK